MNTIKKLISNKALLIPIIILLIYFIIRLVDQSKLIWIFPLDITNDVSSYMAQLHFLKVCGFHEFCPYWYNGFVNFLHYPPAWFFFALPIYLFTNDVQLTTYLSLIILFVFGFILIWYFGKTQKLSKIKRIAFFAFFFANAIAIGNFIRLVRITEVFAWVIFIALAIVLFYYKDRKLDYKFLIFIPLLAVLIMSHATEPITFSFLLLGIFLIKPIKEKLFIVISVLLALLLSSFWWFPFLTRIGETNIGNFFFGQQLLSFAPAHLLQTLTTFIVLPAFLIFFYFYYKSLDKGCRKKELLFFAPIIVLNILVLSRIVVFIPVLNKVYPDPYMFFFLFFTIFFFLKAKYPLKLRRLLMIALILLTIFSVAINHVHTPYFVEHTQLEEDTLSILSKIDGKFVVINSPAKTSFYKAYYCYAPIYYNLTTAGGWFNVLVDDEYTTKLRKIDGVTKKENCEELKNLLDDLNIKYIITYNEDCNTLMACNFTAVERKGVVCAFKNEI